MKSPVTCLPLLSLTLCSLLTSAQTAIPEGTILPARLNTSLNAKMVIVGQQFTARIMQDVPLPRGQKIPEGAKVVGHVVQVAPADAGHPGTLSIRFDSLRFARQTIAVTTSLRALASLSDVQDAETPKTSLGFGTPARWASRTLVGGEVYYGDGEPVMRGPDTVGVGLVDGVLARVSAPRESRCQHAPRTNDPQALWVFSSDACGAFGFDNLQITHAGYRTPRGDIQLTAERGNLAVGSGTGMLLQVNADHN
jgi:hypothetical protein